MSQGKVLVFIGKRVRSSACNTFTHREPEYIKLFLFYYSFIFWCSLSLFRARTGNPGGILFQEKSMCASFFRSLKNSLTVPDKTKLLAVYSLLINSIQSVTLAPSFGNSVAHRTFVRRSLTTNLWLFVSFTQFIRPHTMYLCVRSHSRTVASFHSRSFRPSYENTEIVF